MGTLWHSDHLSAVYPPAAGLAATAAGVVYLPLDRAGDQWLAWLEPELPPIYGDRRHLLTPFTNLLTNAIKYSTREVHPHAEVGLHGHSPDGHPVFFVADNGISILKPEHARVFELFKRSANAGEFPGRALARPWCGALSMLTTARFGSRARPVRVPGSCSIRGCGGPVP